jgi:hypothetical protein
LPEAKEVVGGLPSQTMTADVNLKGQIPPWCLRGEKKARRIAAPGLNF